MNNKKYNNLMRTGVFLTAISVSMFTYQNVIYPNYIESKILVPIYTASRDIKAGEKIDKSMFIEGQIRKSELIDGMVYNIEDFLNKYTKGTLFKGEILTEYRLESQQVDVSQIFEIKFEPTHINDAKAGSYISVYVKIKTDDNRLVVRQLFPRKLLKASEQKGAADGKAVPGLFITVSEQEMKDYYLAAERGEIIGVPIVAHDIITSEDETDNEVQNDVNTQEQPSSNEIFDANSQESLNAVPPTTNEIPVVNTPDIQVENTIPQGGIVDSGGIMDYEVQAGDTLESLVIKFKTNEQRIKELNNNKVVFNVGEIIYVPA